MKKVKCIYGSDGDLFENKIYTVNKENDSVYILLEIDGAWIKSRFQILSENEMNAICLD